MSCLDGGRKGGLAGRSFPDHQLQSLALDKDKPAKMKEAERYG